MRALLVKIATHDSYRTHMVRMIVAGSRVTPVRPRSAATPPSSGCGIGHRHPGGGASVARGGSANAEVMIRR